MLKQYFEWVRGLETSESLATNGYGREFIVFLFLAAIPCTLLGLPLAWITKAAATSRIGLDHPALGLVTTLALYCPGIFLYVRYHLLYRKR